MKTRFIEIQNFLMRLSEIIEVQKDSANSSFSIVVYYKGITASTRIRFYDDREGRDLEYARLKTLLELDAEQ